MLKHYEQKTNRFVTVDQTKMKEGVWPERGQSQNRATS